jgi:glycosyltransferase involved in cell wall biosynthesis
MKKLRVLFVQDHLRNGGAARAASRWSHLLDRAGHIVIQAAGDETSSAGFLLTGKPPRGRQRIVECFTGKKKERKKKVEQRLDELLAKGKPDFVWFHNIAGGRKWGWSEEMISIARQYSPVIWTLHDMWALGDGEEGYFDETSVRSGIKVPRVRELCMEVGKYPIVLTAPSKWLADLTMEITKQKCWHLPNPMDFQVYSPRDQAVARRRFGLPKKGLVILAGADSLKDERKGFDLLLEAWGQGRKDATLALFGRNGQEREGIVNLGSIDTDEAMADAYRAADLYVHPARQENAPCTIQESLACGTPALAFAVGGIPGMVVPRKTGFLVARLSPESLAETLASALADPEQLREMRERCRKYAEEIWSPEKLMRQFAELARGLMAESR